MIYNINKVINRIKNNKFWLSVTKLSSGMIIGQIITLLTTPILTRLYSDSDYGDYGIIVSMASIIIGVIGLGLNSAIMVQKEDKNADRVFRISIILQGVLSTVIMIILLLISGAIQVFQSNLPYVLSLILAYLYICSMIMYNALRIYINRRKLDNVLFFNPLILAVSNLLLTLPLAFLRLGAIGLLTGQLVAYAISSVCMIRKANPFTCNIQAGDLKYVWRECKKFIVYQYPSNLIGTASTQIPNVILSNQFGNGSLGNYSMCIKLFNMPLHLIVQPIQNVYFRFVSQDNSDYEQIARFSYSLITKVCYVALIPSIVLMSFGEKVLPFVLGPSWKLAGYFTQIMVIPFVMGFCYNCITYCRVSIGKQKINMFTSLVHLVLTVSALFAGIVWGKSVEAAILSFAVSETIMNIANVFITFACLKKKALQWLLFSIVYIGAVIGVSLLLKYVFGLGGLYL